MASKTSLRRDRALLMGVSLLTLLATGAQAQEMTASIDELVVTAQRREQKLQDVPSAITAISGDDITKATTSQLSEIVTAAPNVAVNQPYGAGNPPNFVIRGISSTDFSQNQSKPVALYLDEGVKQSQLFESAPIFDIERIEILRGPQGALYGKNATAGAINVISKAPDFTTGGYATAGYGNFNTRHLAGAVQAPLVDGLLAVRLAGMYTKDDGIFKNLTPGLGDTNQTDVAAGRLTFLLTPSDRFTATLRLSTHKAGGRNYTSKPSAIDFSTYPGILAVPGATGAGLAFDENSTSIAPERDIQASSANLLMEWQVSDAYTLTSVTTYDVGEWTDLADADGLPIDWSYFDSRVRDAKQLVEELRLASNHTGPFNWIGGIFLSEDKASYAQDLRFKGDARCGASCPNFLGLPGQGITFVNNFNQKRESAAGYLRAEYAVTPELKISGGVRRTRDKLEVDDYDAYAGSSLLPRGVSFFSDLSPTETTNNTSWEAGVDWKQSSDVLMYASYKEGYRVGAVNAQAFFDPAEVNFAPPETARTGEVGIKSIWLDRRLTVNAALFQTSYVNQQVLNFEAGVLRLRSVDQSRISGFELESAYRASSMLRFNLGLGLLDPKYRSGSVSGFPVGGNQIVNAAKINANVGVDVTLLSDERRELTWNVRGLYTGRTYYDVFNSPALAQDAYWLVNSRLTLDIAPIEISLYANNLLDEEYMAYSLDQAGQLSLQFNLRGAPRQFGAELTYRF